MPVSPFPGMDPYLEAPDVWPDFHDALASEIRTALNASLPSPYYARLEMRPEIGIVAGPTTRRVVPDVAVVRTHSPPGQRPAATSAAAVLDSPRTQASPGLDVEVFSEPLRHAYVEVRDPARGHKLVTLIEIVSPSNKAPGPDRDAYLAKQEEVLASDASLIEIDLLRGGSRPLRMDRLSALIGHLGKAKTDYLVLVHRAWAKAGAGTIKFQAFPVSVREILPCIPVPLREGEPETPLDLQYALTRAYAGGPYARGAVNYGHPPDPPLAGEDAEWAQGLVRSFDT
jgi:uncharacterized protein DUF4058